MPFWYRINHSRIKLLTHQFWKCYHAQTPLLFNHTAKVSISYTLENQIQGIFKVPTDFVKSTRFFSTLFQTKLKDEENTTGPRLNEQIRAQFVRLVKDGGHMVVPLREALAQARNLKLDLVEVQRNANPPVCKLMDFNQQKYKQHLKEKDRAKSKSESSLRKGDYKEVRFSEKTEQKDLKMKADTVIRLMQRNYRVKCVVASSRKKGSGRPVKKGSGVEELTQEEIAEQRRQEEEEEREELKALLSRFTGLIKDEAFVESAPSVEKRQAYVIVRHVKFGPPKKAGAKKLKDVGKTATANATLVHSDEDEDDSVVDSKNDYERVFDRIDDGEELNMNHVEEMMKGPVEADSSNISPFGSRYDFKQTDGHPTSARPSFPAGNRYKRSEPTEQVSSTAQPSFPAGNRYKRSERTEQVSPNTTGDNRYAFRNTKFPPADEMLKQDSSLRASSYGAFSSSKASTPGKQGVAAEVNNNKGEANRHSSGSGNRESGAFSSSKSDGKQRPVNDGKSGQGKWGIFSRDTPSANQNRISK